MLSLPWNVDQHALRKHANINNSVLCARLCAKDIFFPFRILLQKTSMVKYSIPVTRPTQLKLCTAVCLTTAPLLQVAEVGYL